MTYDANSLGGLQGIVWVTYHSLVGAEEHRIKSLELCGPNIAPVVLSTANWDLVN